MPVNESDAAGPNGGLRDLMREVRALERQLRQAPSWGLGIPAGGGAVLQELLEHGDQTVPQIGRRRGTSRQNVQVLVNGLKADGWVEMAQNPVHRRSELVRLTDKGRQAVEQMAQEEMAFLERMSGQVSVEAVSAAAGVLRQVRALLAGKREPGKAKVERKEAPPRETPRPKPEPPPAAPEETPADEGELPVSLL